MEIDLKLLIERMGTLLDPDTKVDSIRTDFREEVVEWGLDGTRTDQHWSEITIRLTTPRKLRETKMGD